MLKLDFYQNTDVCAIAKALLGKKLVTNFGTTTSGIISEVESYSYREKACHAYLNKKTKRNTPMFESGGIAYVYLCYGMHPLFNVVTNKNSVAEAILIRAIEPIDGIEMMQKRRGKKENIANGPGKLTQALGIQMEHNGQRLNSKTLWIEDVGFQINKNKIECTKRIGIAYAQEDADLLWRFTIKASEHKHQKV